MNKPVFSEQELIRHCQQGDGEAFRFLIEQYRSALFGTAYLMVRDRQAAEEVVQETILKMWQHISSLRDYSRVKPWLMQILVNEVKHQFRKKRVTTVPLEQATELTDDYNADQILINSENHHALRRALLTLPPEQKEVVVLRYFADLTIPEIAAATSIREGTVKSRISRALNHLGEILSDSNKYEGRK